MKPRTVGHMLGATDSLTLPFLLRTSVLGHLRFIFVGHSCRASGQSWVKLNQHERVTTASATFSAIPETTTTFFLIDVFGHLVTSPEFDNLRDFFKSCRAHSIESTRCRWFARPVVARAPDPETIPPIVNFICTSDAKYRGQIAKHPAESPEIPNLDCWLQKLSETRPMHLEGTGCYVFWFRASALDLSWRLDLLLLSSKTAASLQPSPNFSFVDNSHETSHVICVESMWREL